MPLAVGAEDAPRPEAGPTIPRIQPRLAQLVAFVAAAICTYALRQVDPDLYGYLSYGKLFVGTGEITSHDPFAYTSANATWITFEWLAHVLLWLSYDYGGPAGLIALKCAVGGMAIYFLYAITHTLADDDPSVWLPIFLFSTATVSRFFVFRPQIFTFAFFALFVAILMRDLVHRRARLWVLPPAMLLWANAHGGFLAGLGAIGLAILVRLCQNVSEGGRSWRALSGTRSLWLTLLACLAVTFVNPRGLSLWQYVLTEVLHGTNRQYIAEWRPTHTSGDVVTFISLLVATLILLVLGVLAVRQTAAEGATVSRCLAISCVPTVAMSYISIRHTPLALIWAAPVVALLVARFRIHRSRAPLVRATWLLLVTIGFIWTLFATVSVAVKPEPRIAAGGTSLGREHPCRAVAFLRDNGATGNLYTPLWWGAYVTWELYPAIRVSMDGRNISLFPGEMVRENLQFYLIKSSEPNADVPLRYDTDFVLVPNSSANLQQLQSDKRWERVYADNDAAVFVRTSRRDLLKASAPGRQETATPSCSPVLR